MSRFQRPETVLKRAEELIGVGQTGAALQALSGIFELRSFKQTPLASLEPIMLRFTDLCVELRRGRLVKDGLVQYKNVSQNTNPAAIEVAIKHLIKLSEQRVADAQAKADKAAADEDIEDLEESETPESMLLGAVTSEEDRDRTDRALVTPWLKFLWESYRTALDILRNNARLEVPYQQIANQALKFCMQYQRKTEFRRLCDLLRTHLQNVARYAHHTHAINLADPDTLQRHLDTRFAQLNSAVELELWQEAFRSVEDVHNLLTMAKKAPRPSMMANYYEKLTRIFMVSDNNLFHAAAWNRYYSLARGGIKTEEEHTRMASSVLLSALAVPVISSSAPGTGNMNKSKSDFLLGDQETRSRTGRLTSLLGLSRTPTRAGLLKEALNRNILKRVRPELRELYNILEVEFHPLSICEKIEPILAKLAEDEEMAKYVKPLHSVVLTRLFQQLSQVYDAVKLTRVMELVAAFKAPNSYTAADIEKFCLNACKKGHLNIRVDHVTQAITFQDDVFAAEHHPAAAGAAAAGGDLDAVRLQATPGELVRTQLARLAECLDTTIHVIDPSLLQAAQQTKADVFARAVAQAEKEHKAALARKAILARRKEILEERASRKEREEATAKAERIKAAAAAETKRVEDEKRRRELERVRKEMEAVKAEEAKKMAQNLKEKGGLKLTEEEYANLDTDKLVQLQVEQIEREKKELAERLRIIHRRMDHLERAYRREELPLIETDYARQKEEDQKYHSAARATLVATTREKHAADVELKQRLQRIMPDYKELRKVLEGKRKHEMEQRQQRAQAQIDEEKQKRRVQVAKERKLAEERAVEDKKRAEEEAEREKLRAEQEERDAEQRALEKEKEKEREAEKRKEIEERLARVEEQSAKQRAKEREIEEKLAARSARPAVGAAAAAPDSPGGGLWRSRGAPAGAVAEARTASPAAPPVIARAAGAGGWREREAAARAAGSSAPTSSGAATPVVNGTASPARGAASPAGRGTSSPAFGAPSAAAAPAPAAAARPPVFGGRTGGAPSWRDREAAKSTGAAPAPSSPARAPAASSPAPAAAAAAPAAGEDGFEKVTRKAYVPPARRG